MKQPRIEKVLKDSKAVKGTRKRSKEIEEVQKMLREEVAYSITGLVFRPHINSIDILHSKVRYYRRLAIAGWLVALTLSGAFIWQNLDQIVNLTQYVKWVG